MRASPVTVSEQVRLVVFFCAFLPLWQIQLPKSHLLLQLDQTPCNEPSSQV